MFCLILLIAGESKAGRPVSDACRVSQGTCTLRYPIPIGSGCYCGRYQGTVVYSGQNNQTRDPNVTYSTTCLTPAGSCSTTSSPVGSRCYCDSNPGRVIDR